MTGPAGGSCPWRDGDMVMVSVTALLGVVAVVVAWFGASGEVSHVRQMAWMNLAIGGFVVFAGGIGLWLLRLRRSIGARRVSLVCLEVDDAPDIAGPIAANAAATPVRSRPGSTASLSLVRAVGMSRVHDPGCPLVAGKAVQPATSGSGARCGVCAA